MLLEQLGICYFSASMRRTKQVGKKKQYLLRSHYMAMEKKKSEVTSQAIGTRVHPFVCQK